MLCPLKMAIIIGLASLGISAFAGQYSCTGYGDAGCSKHLNDIVTDKFTSKFPSAKYEIVAVYDFQTYSDGGGVGFATVGVSPKVLESHKYGELSLMPIRRFTATQRNTGDQVSPYQTTEFKIDLLRRAIQMMMEACDRDASCKILKIE